MSRKGWAWTIIGVMFAVLVVVLVVNADDLTDESANRVWEEKEVEGKGEAKIVQLFVDGTIAESAGFGSSFNSPDFLEQLDQALEDDDVKGVVLRVNSPGGEVVASDEIHNKILEMKKKGKKVIVSMGAMAASGGYYISAPADYIFANPSTLTGSLGVIFSIPNYEELADWAGYKENVIKSGAFKDIGNPLREMTPAEQQVFTQLVDESYQQFVDVIANGRKIPREQVLKIADGRIYSGKQAKALKLIDEFGSLEDATRYAVKASGLTEARIVRYEVPGSLTSILLGGMSAQTETSVASVVEKVVPHLSQKTGLYYMYQP